mgnify:CR=1 FL=1
MAQPMGEHSQDSRNLNRYYSQSPYMHTCALPGRFIDNKTAEKILDAFFKASFEGGRHERRVKKIPVQQG